MPAILARGRTAVRDHLKTLISHVGLATDQTAFADGQTELDPANAGASERLIKASAIADVDGDTAEYTITIDGDTELTDQPIYTIGAMEGATRTDVLSRSVRNASTPIGVQAGDSFTVGIRLVTEDNTP